MTDHYDIFVSYAHSDNDDGWVDSFVDNVTSIYRKLTGVSPATFLDRESLITSDIWERKIHTALNQSSLFLAVVSPSYVLSPWCQKEWMLFEEREDKYRKQGLLPEEQGLLFPVLLYPLQRGKFGGKEKAFSESISRRQWMDVSSQVEGTPIRSSQIREITESLIDIEAEIQTRIRDNASSQSMQSFNDTILDRKSNLEWAGELSKKALTIEEAIQFVEKLHSDNDHEWRLPTKTELETLIDPDALVDDPEASPFPLKAPFNAQKYGHLHSSTPVFTDLSGGHYIMNVRNGHIFNGKGCSGYVRAVRELGEKEKSNK